jgi:hypothetical protein
MGTKENRCVVIDLGHEEEVLEAEGQKGTVTSAEAPPLYSMPLTH